MHYLKNWLVICFLLFVLLPVTYSQSAYPDPHYKPLKSADKLQDRNFYFFTLLEEIPAVKRLLAEDSLLATCRQRIAGAVVNNLLFPDSIISRVNGAWKELLQRRPQEMSRLTQEMRSSGFFVLYAAQPDEALLIHAWQDAANGVNYIINAYTKGLGMRYPLIDSAAFYVNDPGYKAAVRRLAQQVEDKDKAAALFFKPRLDMALGLLALNRRDEAARYEPLEAANAAAYKQVKKTAWKKYPYSALVILGASPGGKEPVSETGKSRCRTGAELFRKGLAPFIIVSGGHVRPAGTPYSEAVEMRKYLVNELKIPATAVMIDPYARHTTTNLRNAIRVAWRGGVPVNKKMLCVSDAMHLFYVNSSVFTQRCLTELGYMPAAEIRQADLYFLSFMPDLRSLQADARDPLDP